MTRFMTPVRSTVPRLSFIPQGDRYLVTTAQDRDEAQLTGQWLKGKAVEVEV